MVTSVAFHPAGTVVASASTDRSIKLFDIRTHKLIQHYGDAHAPSGGGTGGGGVNSIAFGGVAGEWLISTGMDGVVKIWDLKEGHLFYTLHGHKQGPTTSAVFSPKGDFFATGGSDAQVMVWKSNFDEISKLVEKEGDSTAPRDRPLPHSQSQYFHQHHGLHTEPTQANGTVRGKSPVSVLPTVVNGSGGMTHRKGGNPDVINVGAGLFAEQDIEEEGATGTYPQHHAQASPSRARSPERASGRPQSYTTALEERTVPDQLANTLQQIVRQLDILTQTMNIMESRLTMNEDRVVEMGRRMTDVLNRLEQQNQARATPPPSAGLGVGTSGGGVGSNRGGLVHEEEGTHWRPTSFQQQHQQQQQDRQNEVPVTMRTAWQDFDRSVNSGIAPSAPPLSESKKEESGMGGVGVGSGEGGGGVANG
ncbi:POC1 centriolar protein A [Rhizophlyctis rosea]|nr:POC1 centriolar protein A [Rhizophlyctis rosea]